jgi:RimJ/RimL family protein N-acetyltransferase
MTERIAFIRTPVSTLRPLMESDIPLLMKWVNDPDVREYVGMAMPQGELNEKKWLQLLAEDQVAAKNMAFMIETPEGQAIGTMGLHRIDLKNRAATTGAMIGSREHWGKGIGSATKMHLLEYAFMELGLHRITSEVFEYNERSVRYSLRCGYKEEGRQREAIYKKGRYWDKVLLGLLKAEWQPLWEKYQQTGSLK